MSGEGEFPVNSLRVCINRRKEDSEVEGFLCSIALKDILHFTGKIEFVLKVDEAYDRIGRPQPQEVLRSFQENSRPLYNSYNGNPVQWHTSEEIRKYSGSEVTYDLAMLSRKHAEWQGILKDAAGEIKGKFDSVLGCLKML